VSPQETHSGRHPRRPALSGDVRRLTLDDLPVCLDLAADPEWRGFASRMMRAAMERAGSGPVVLYATEYGRLPDGDLTRRFAPLMQALG
jgi:hypothetical protein